MTINSRRVLAVLSVTMLLIGGSLFVSQIWWANGSNCAQEGPFPAQGLSEFEARFTQSLSLLPIGRVCEWNPTSGPPVVAQSGNFATTGITYGALLLGLVGLGTLWSSRSRRGKEGT